jgi:hypothetical protein
MKKIYEGGVPAALLTPTAVHRALSHLMDRKAQVTRHLATTHDGRMAWFNTFPTKYYL